MTVEIRFVLSVLAQYEGSLRTRQWMIMTSYIRLSRVSKKPHACSVCASVKVDVMNAYAYSPAAGSVVTRDTTETVTIQLSKLEGGRNLAVEPGVRIFIDMVGIRAFLIPFALIASSSRSINLTQITIQRHLLTQRDSSRLDGTALMNRI